MSASVILEFGVKIKVFRVLFFELGFQVLDPVSAG
jgi:hypothetical protein